MRSGADSGRGEIVATAGTAASRLTGFLRLGAMTFALGVAESRLADTYNLANTTPNILYELVLGGILSSVLIRVYIETRQKDGEGEAFEFISRLTIGATLLLAAIALLGIVAAPWIFRLYTVLSPQSELQQEAGTFLLRLFVPQLVFYGLSTISTAVLNAHRRFGVPMFAPVLNNLAVTATMIAFALLVPRPQRGLADVPGQSLWLLGLGTTGGVALMGLIPWLSLRRIGYRLRRPATLRDPRFRKLAKLSAYMLGYVATNQAGLAVAMILANRVQGGVTAYQYAFVFFQLPHGLLAVSIATAAFPLMTEKAVAGDYAGVAATLNSSLRRTAFFVLPAIAGYLAIAPKLVEVLLEHGVATAASTALVATVLRAWAPGIFFFSTFYVILRAFYSLGDTRTPMLINLGAFAVNVAIDLVLFVSFTDPAMRIAGLAIGHAASYAVASAAGAVMLGRRLSSPVGWGGWNLARTLGAAALTGGAAWLAASSVPEGGFTRAMGSVAVAMAAGVAVYASAAKALGLEEMSWIAGIFRRRPPVES